MQNNFYNNFEKYTKIAPPGVEMPSFDISDDIQKKYNLKDKNPTELLKALINEGWIRREINKKPNKEEYKERVKKELDVVCKIEAQEYFLIIWDIINYCVSHDIPTGYARGSSGSSLLLYLINVTNIDPLKHNLIFERFISADRVDTVEENGKKYFLSLPDVDLDISANRRSEVIQYLKEKYKGKFCKISNYSTQETRVALKNTAKLGFNYKESEINEITSLLPVIFGKNKSFDDSIKEVPKFAQWAKENEKCVEIAKKLRGLMVSFGVHASGYVVSNQELEKYMSTYLDKEGEIVSSYDMSIIESLAIKVDLLGLKTLDVIDITLKEMGIKYYDFINNPDIIGFNIDNSAIYEYFQENKYPKGIFQLESGTACNCTNKIKPNSIDEVSAVTSLARPGGLQSINPFADVKFGKKEFNKVHPIMDKILSETKGYIVYQEQIMFILNQLYQFSMKDANKLRKSIGHKKREEVETWKNKIYEKGKKLGIDEKVTDVYWSTLNSAADYSFCKCLHPNTLVNLDIEKQKTIKDINIGENIETFNTKTGENEFNKVINKYHSVQKLYEVELEDGKKIKCSFKHKFLTKDNKMHTLEFILNNNLEIVTK
jgi:DNA polymerase-3 subunit alpha